MYHKWTRRSFLAAGPSLAAVTRLRGASKEPRGFPDETFPSQPYALVRETVGVAHGNLERVRELVAAHPALAKSAIDWGFGDWESALGAASHTGNRKIALLLIENGARPTLFSATMLGQIEVVKAFVDAHPGIQSQPGPHGIPLLTHARLGGDEAAQVLAYLKGLEGVGQGPAQVEISEEARKAYLGTYRFGTGDNDTLRVFEGRFGMMVQRSETTARGLVHLGDHTFHPAGADAVRIEFEVAGELAQTLTVRDHDLIVVARR